MADEETEQDRSPQIGTEQIILALRERLQDLAAALKDSAEPAVQSASLYCQKFCQVLVEFAGQWKIDVHPLPLLEVYTEAILSYARATPYLSFECENVSLLLERLTLSCVELLLAQAERIPGALWERFQASVQAAHSFLEQNGNAHLHMLSALARESGVWSSSTLCQILSKDTPQKEKVHEFLALEGPILLEMRIKHLIKENHLEKAALLAKECSECPEFKGRGTFKQTYLVCLCAIGPEERLMQEISEVDCKDALEMVCNLESDGDERGALSLCSAFLTRQLLQGELYCAWELTLFWSKLLKRLEPSAQAFLDRCCQLSRLSKTVYHILFFIKVIQSELEDVGLRVCVEMCIRALQMVSGNDGNVKATICKTISCLLPTDLEVKRACQLTEFLLDPTVDSYYAVETLYNEPDQKLEEENLPVPNSLRCELLLAFKTQWPFDPEFWDWKTLKRHCLVLMGEQASIVSSIDELNDSENVEEVEDDNDGIRNQEEFKDPTEYFLDTTNQLNEIEDEKQKKREVKKLREKGFISARFRNWQAYVQYCVLCDKEFLGHRIVRHAQKHFSDGVYSCPICTANFDSKEQLMPHVASHVKQSSKERLAAMKTSRALASSSKRIIPGSPQNNSVEKLDCKPKTKGKADSADSPIATNGDCEEMVTGKSLKPDITEFGAEKADEYLCPVMNCQKSFKFFRNLIAHLKTHGNNEEAKRFLEIQSKKVVCHFCRRHFVSIAHLNDHLQMHCGDKPYICVQLNCKASFLSNAELLTHRKEHATFKAKCMFPNCGRIFSEAYLLYDHEAQHYNTYTCKFAGCGKLFHAQSQLDLHQECHLKKEDPLNTEVQTSSPGLKTEPPTQKPFDQNPNHSPPVDSEPSGGHVSFTEAPSTPSKSASEMSSQLAGPVEIKHSVQRMLNTFVGPTQGSDYNLPLKTEPADRHQEQFPLPNSDNPVIQSSMNMYVSDPLGLDSVPPSPLRDIGQTGSQGKIPYQGVASESHVLSHADLQQSHLQNVALFTTSKQSLLPGQPPDWPSSHNERGTLQQDAKSHSYAWSHAETSHSVLCKGDAPDSVPSALPQDGNAIGKQGSSDCTGPMPENPSCMLLGKQTVAEQTPPCTSAIPTTPKSVASPVVFPQTVPLPAVGSGTVGTVLHYPSKNSSAPPEGVKERHYCPFETCTRNYSCSKSVTKHMKAAHPEFFVEWKLAKQNAKAVKATTRKVSVGINKAVVNVCTQSTTKQQFLSQPGNKNPTASSENPTENLLNSVLLSQSGQSQSECAPTWTGPMQSNMAHSSVWPSHVGSSSSVSGQTDCTSGPLPLQSPANHQIYSQMNNSCTGYPSQTGAAFPPPFTQDGATGPVFMGQPNLMNQLSSAQNTAISLMSTQIHSGAWQSDSPRSEENASTVFGAWQPDKANSTATPDSADGKTSELHRINQPSLQNPNINGTNPNFQSHMNQVSQLSALLSGEGLCPSHVATSISPAQMNITAEALVHVASSSHAMPPNTEDKSSSMLPSAVENVFLPPTLGSVKDFTSHDQVNQSVNPVLSSPMQNSSLSRVSSSEGVECPQINPGFLSEGAASHPGADVSLSENRRISMPDEMTQGVKKSKRDRRTKWPAIIKDGKFFCCRCFREFQSPKSLGGHLSKRSLCKDVNETDLSAGLLGSLLDLKSPPALNACHQPEFDQNKPSEDRLEFFPNVNFPQGSGSSHEGEQNGEALKPLIDNPLVRNLFDPSKIPQGTFQKPCDSSLSDDNLPESTVIQHTENLNFKTENTHPEEDYANSKEPCLHRSVLSDPVSSLLSQANVALSMNPTAHLNEMLRAEALRKLIELKGKAGQSNESVLAAISSLVQNLRTELSQQNTTPSPLQQTEDSCQKKNCEENVKKKLRDQILAGDLLRMASVCGDHGADESANSNLSGVPQTLHKFQSIEHSRATQIAPKGEHGIQFNSSGASTVSPYPSNGELQMESHTQESVDSSVGSGTSVSEVVRNHIDQSLALSLGEDEKVTEIQRALQKLDLEDRPALVSCPSVSVASCRNDKSNSADSLKPVDVSGAKEGLVLGNVLKPFSCKVEGCQYGAMTKEALFKHLSRVHNYTDEMIKEIKNSPAKLAPFLCHICNKTFTRNSNLRVHCNTVHNLSREEMQKIKPQQTKKAENEITERTCNKPVSGCVSNPSSIQNVSSNYATANKSVDGRPEQLVSEKSTVSSQEIRESCPQSFKEQVSTGSSLVASAKGVTLVEPVYSAQQIPMKDERTTVLDVTGHLTESSMIKSPQPHQLSDMGHASMTNQSLVGQLAEAKLPAADSVGIAGIGPHQAASLLTQSSSPEKPELKLNKPKMLKPEIPKKAKEKKEKTSDVDDIFSPYRPYRCVHQGCVAAFTIQQNLILHYRAVHQSALPKFNEERQEEEHCEVRSEGEDEVVRIREFRCQVKDCSRIFPKFTSLLQHYLQLHKFTLERAGTLISNINLSQFQCDQPECTASFSAFQKYIEHIKEDHQMTVVTNGVEGTFRCECDGCDRVYSTRSNLLRHVMKKHRAFYRLLMRKQRNNSEGRRQATAKRSELTEVKSNSGKENRENQRLKQKGGNKRKNHRASHHWTSFGKPSLKSLDEASGMCTKRFPLQYPCMLKGCESVMSSERNILRHYVSHGLTERYIEEQRSGFIFCKKYSRSKYRGSKRSEGSSSETSENEDTDGTGPEESDAESSKCTSVTEGSCEPPEAKQSSDESSETKSDVPVKRKRGRPRKVDCPIRQPVTPGSRKESLRNGASKVNQVSNGVDSASIARVQEELPEKNISLNSFRPMGFEASFLKFLEESTESTNSPKRKATDAASDGAPSKRRRTLQQKTVNIICERPYAYRHMRDRQSLVDFRNPLKLKSVKNVKIVVDRTFSSGAELLLKQLQEMRPMVVLKKWLYS